MSLNLIPANHGKIAALAHKFWEDEGYPEGQAENHWQRALNAFAALEAKPALKKPAAKKPAKAKA